MKKYIAFMVLCLLILIPNIAHAYNNKAIPWGFARSKDEQIPQAGKELDALLQKYNSYYLGDSSKKIIYLTFDNGYENGFTERILNILQEKKVPAAFFITGAYLKQAPNLVKRMVNEGHIVGNHSYHHPDMTTISDDKIREELRLVKEEFTKLTGSTHMQYLRPPRGVFSERVLAVSNAEGYQSVFWSLAFVDWKTDQQKGAQYAYDNVLKQIHPGAVILLHAVSSDNASALPKIIDDLQKRGYVFKSLDDKLIDDLFKESILLH